MVGFVNENGKTYAGKHLLIDFYNCDPERVLNLDAIELVMKEAATDTGATVLFSHTHPFEGGGSSGVVILAESHITYHSWTENNFVAIDIFVCGECTPYAAIPVFYEYFKPEWYYVKSNLRGSEI